MVLYTEVQTKMYKPIRRRFPPPFCKFASNKHSRRNPRFQKNTSFNSNAKISPDYVVIHTYSSFCNYVADAWVNIDKDTKLNSPESFRHPPATAARLIESHGSTRWLRDPYTYRVFWIQTHHGRFDGGKLAICVTPPFPLPSLTPISCLSEY